MISKPLDHAANLAHDLAWLTTVGVAGHIHHDRLDADVRPQIYFNYRQRAGRVDPSIALRAE